MTQLIVIAALSASAAAVPAAPPHGSGPILNAAQRFAVHTVIPSSSMTALSPALRSTPWEQSSSIRRAVERIAVRAALPPPQVRTSRKDSVANGIVIGAVAGAAAGWFLAPRVFCGPPGNDTECDAIVKRFAWPGAAGGALLGWLIDALI